MLKHVTVIMDVHAILMDFAEHWFYFIFVAENMTVANPRGINMICAFSWPKTIHEDNETAQLLLEKIQPKNNLHKHNFQRALSGSLPRL